MIKCAASVRNACTSLPSQPSPHCCRPPFKGETVNAATVDVPQGKNSFYIEGKSNSSRNKRKTPSAQGEVHTETNKRCPDWLRKNAKDVTTALPPAVEDSRLLQELTLGFVSAFPTSRAALPRDLSSCRPHYPDRCMFLLSPLLLFFSTRSWPCDQCSVGK